MFGFGGYVKGVDSQTHIAEQVVAFAHLLETQAIGGGAIPEANNFRRVCVDGCDDLAELF